MRDISSLVWVRSAPLLHPPDDGVSAVPASGDRLARGRGKGDQGGFEEKGINVEIDDAELAL